MIEKHFCSIFFEQKCKHAEQLFVSFLFLYCQQYFFYHIKHFILKLTKLSFCKNRQINDKSSRTALICDSSGQIQSELLQREQAEMAQQLANLQTDVRVSYGNDALMPDQEIGDGQTDLLPQEDTLSEGVVGFIHPESFNQPNTDNQGT